MATCNLYFYKTNITPDKNRVYDDPSDSLLGNSFIYSSAITLVYTKLNFQYLKVSLRMTIKASLTQSEQYNQSVNYLRLVDTTTSKTYYFYITKFEWVAQNTIRCELFMDTMQTFRDQIYANITSMTYVVREHSDRAYDDNGTIKRIISKTDEGIGVVEKELIDYQSITPSDDNQKGKGFLAYFKDISKNGDETSPVTLSFFSESGIVVEDGQTSANSITYTKNSFGSLLGKYEAAIISKSDSPNFEIKGDGDTDPYTPFSHVKYVNGEILHCEAVIILNPTHLDAFWNKVLFIYVRDGSEDLQGSESVQINLAGTDLNLRNIMYLRRITTTDFTNMAHIDSIVNDDQLIILRVGDIDQAYLASINGTEKFDFSDSHLQKVIQFPFFPLTFDTLETHIPDKLPTGYGYNFRTKCLVMKGLRRIPSVQYNSVNLSSILSGFVNYGTSLNARNIQNESKLFNSNYFTFKFAFGNDVKEYKLEQLSASSITPVAEIYPSFTSTILFNFGNDIDTNSYTANEDFFSEIVTTRDNDIPLFNSAYLDYIRLQYATDKANLKQSQDQKNASLAGSITSSVASLASGVVSGTMFGGATGSPIGAIAGGIVGGIIGVASSSVSTALSVANTSASIAEQNRTFASKINSLSCQNIGFTGNSDTWLLNYIGRFNLFYYTYQAPQAIRNQLFDKFFFTGYAVGYRKLPDFTSRRLFNFVQCVPVFNNYSLNISQEYLDDIIDRLTRGVTFMHCYNSSGTFPTRKNYYDEEQQYENMEVSLIS